MNNKGYTIMEAVIAMFLVVVMVGAVFSALMSGRRAITTSSEKEEIFYSLQSTYGMLKDCRSNPDCHLKNLNCNYAYTGSNQNLKGCDSLFTFNFANLCKGATETNGVGVFRFNVSSTTTAPTAWLSVSPGVCSDHSVALTDFYVLNIEASCTE